MDAGPVRTCVGCRTKRPKSELARVAISSDGSFSTEAGAGGRGAYLCRDGACVEAAFATGRLRRALRCDRLPDGLQHELMRKGSHG